MSTKIARYDNDHDMQMRLGNTYIRYKGEPYFAEAIGSLRLMLHRVVPDTGGMLEPHTKVDANDPDLDISSIPLGYCNIKRYGSVYLTRSPERRQRQGVSMQNISGFDETVRQWRRPLSKYLTIPPDALFSTIKNDYPDLSTVLRVQRTYPVAFHRRLCLTPLPFKDEAKKWKIKYMSQFIGLLSKQDDGRYIARLTGESQGNSFLHHIFKQHGVEYHAW